MTDIKTCEINVDKAQLLDGDDIWAECYDFVYNNITLFEPEIIAKHIKQLDDDPDEHLSMLLILKNMKGANKILRLLLKDNERLAEELRYKVYDMFYNRIELDGKYYYYSKKN